MPVIFIANSAQNNIIISSLAGDIVAKIGSGKDGFEDGDFEDASFSFPQGLLFDANKLYVADSGNHAIRMINFKEGKVSTIIGSGLRGNIIKDVSEADKINLSSPNDLEFFPDKENIAISNSGSNQILSYNLKTKNVSVLSGNGNQGYEDGKYPQNSLAQTSDMSVFGRKLYFVDALTSSLRVLDDKGNVKTLVGNAGKFGYSNGERSKALMQNPLGLSVDDTGVYIADSFNHKIRKYDFSSAQIRDLIGSKKGDKINKIEFDEPQGIRAVLDRFYIADSNNNRIIILQRSSLNAEVLNVMPPLKLPKESFMQYLPNLQKSEEVIVKSGVVIPFKIQFSDGWKINDSAPSFINLLELIKSDQANLVASFDWHLIKNAEMVLPKLNDNKDYLLQGVIYYCEDKKNALCYVKSYEQKIAVKNNETNSQITMIINSAKKN